MKPEQFRTILTIMKKMTKIRADKVAKIAELVPGLEIDNGPDQGDVLILGWGSTYGSIKTAVRDLLAEGYSRISCPHEISQSFPFQY